MASLLFFEIKKIKGASVNIFYYYIEFTRFIRYNKSIYNFRGMLCLSN